MLNPIKNFATLAFLLFASLSQAVTLKPYLDGSDKVRFDKYMVAVIETEKAVNSSEFQEWVKVQKFTSTKLSGLEVLLKINQGAELLSPEIDFEWDWGVGFYRKASSKVIGWTNPQIKTVWVNTAKFDFFKPHDIAGNIAHEYMHKIGFDHASARDHKSVPYAVGYKVEELVKKGISAPSPIPTIPPVVVTPKPEPRPYCGFWCRLRSIFR